MPYTTEQIREMLKKITQGEWFSHGGSVSLEPVNTQGFHDEEGICHLNDGEYIENKNKDDAAFIAASPAIITQLLDREDEIKRKIGEMKEEAKNAGEDEMNFAYECVLDLFN